MAAPVAPADEGELCFVQGLSLEGFHRVAYRRWGNSQSRKLLFCCHGLTNNSLDFIDIVEPFRGSHQIVAIDVVGRGRSGRLGSGANYTMPQYLADINVVINRFDFDELHWLGTSMGGLLGILYASMPNSRVSRLVLNDIGPDQNPAALAHIAEYVGGAPDFATAEDAQGYFRALYSPGFGDRSDEFWKRYAAGHVWPGAKEGTLAPAYDRALAEGMRIASQLPPAAVSLKPMWRNLKCPVLVLHGETSAVLTTAQCEALAKEAGPPSLSILHFPGVGHPIWLDGEPRQKIVEWFASQENFEAEQQAKAGSVPEQPLFIGTAGDSQQSLDAFRLSDVPAASAQAIADAQEPQEQKQD